MLSQLLFCAIIIDKFSVGVSPPNWPKTKSRIVICCRDYYSNYLFVYVFKVRRGKFSVFLYLPSQLQKRASLNKETVARKQPAKIALYTLGQETSLYFLTEIELSLSKRHQVFCQQQSQLNITRRRVWNRTQICTILPFVLHQPPYGYSFHGTAGSRKALGTKTVYNRTRTKAVEFEHCSETVTSETVTSETISVNK